MSKLAQTEPVADDQAAQQLISSDSDCDNAGEPSSSGCSSSEESDTECSKHPWGRFVVLWCMCALATGVMPGGALWIKLFADAGLAKSLCSDGDGKEGDTCKNQFVALTGIFAIGGQSVSLFNVIIGLMYDRWGAQKVGAGGVALCAAGMLIMALSVQSSQSGQDATAVSILTIGVLVTDFGALLNTYALIGMTYYFPGRQTLVLTLVGNTYPVASFLPLIIAGLMWTAGAGLLSALVVYTAALAIVAPICWRLLPTPKEYYEQAERVLGTRLPEPPKGCYLCSMFKGAWRIVKQNLRDHAASMLAYIMGFNLPNLYSAMSAPYGEALFNSEDAGTKLAEMYVTVNGIVSFLIAPATGQAADKFGLESFVVCMGIGMAVATMTCAFANWPAQLLCQVGLVVFNTLLTPVVQRYVICYAPPNRLGACTAFYWMVFTLLALPAMTVALSAVSLFPPGVDAYRIPMVGFGVLGTLAMGLYGLYFRNNPPPETPIELEEDKQEEKTEVSKLVERQADAKAETLDCHDLAAKLEY